MLGEPLTTYHDKECLNIVQIGGYWNWGPPPNAGPTWYDEPHSQLHAFISPQGVENGIINLKPAGIDDFDTDATGEETTANGGETAMADEEAIAENDPADDAPHAVAAE